MKIFFEFEDNSYNIAPSTLEYFSPWISQVAIVHKKRIAKLHYTFMNDEQLLAINQEFLNHNYYTDIITFGAATGNSIKGEIFISLDRVSENAKQHKIDFYDELKRVVIHGVLHLIGYNDQSENEKNNMRFLENQALQIYDQQYGK